MVYPKPWWHRLSPSGNHRIQVALIALVAFTAGLIAGPYGARAVRSVTGTSAVAPPAITAPERASRSVMERTAAVPADRLAGQQSAHELDHQAGKPLPPVKRSVEQWLALEPYGSGERALPPVKRSVEQWLAMEPYVAGEPAMPPVTRTAAQQRAWELYRQDHGPR